MNERKLFHVAWAVPATAAFLIYSLWSINRYERFGAGAWDLGCRSQSIWLLAHARGFTSSVLGNVNFMGDHFMPSLVLLAPIGWSGSPALLLGAQAALIATAAWPLALLCRRRALPPLLVFAIVAAYLFAVGTQSTANFDFHEVALLPLTLLLAIWGFEEQRRILAYAALIVAAGSRETAIVYAAGVGLWLALRPGRRLEGLSIAVASVVIFYAVVSWVQPRLLRDAPPSMMPMARFSAMSGTLQGAVLRAALHPMQTAQLLVFPTEKIATLAITFGGFAFLPLLAPDAMAAAVPNVLERFLSDNKPEMWGMGYHYSLILTALSAFATVVAIARIRTIWLGEHSLTSHHRFDAVICAVLLAAPMAASAASMPVGVELVSFDKPYFASPAQTDVNRRALAAIPPRAAVVAQNHFLPHLAMRERVWLPEQRFVDEADYVVLDPTQSAWPYDRGHIERLTQSLSNSRAFHVVFSEGATMVFARTRAVNESSRR